MNNDRAVGRRKIIAATLLAIGGYLSLESFLPPDRQASAVACVTAIRGYQAVGSPAMAAAGVRCRYTPTCSHYAAAAFSHYGTLEGFARTAGRLWRCSPWGGMGHDPAVASLAFVPPQETPEEKKAREEQQKKFEQDARKAAEEIKKAWEQAGPEAGKAAGACAAGCIISIVASIVGLVIWVLLIVYVLKDAKSRGDANAVLWVVLIVFLHIIGFVVYFVARPKGELVPCANCKNRKLEILTKCPHCGADAAGGVKA